VKRIRDAEIVGEIRNRFPVGFRGYALEIGAADGSYLSNTSDLENLGWDVLCIEPNPDYYATLKERRKITLNVACAAKSKNYQDLLVYRRKGRTDGDPISALGGLTPAFVEKFCPEVGAPETIKVNVRTLDWCLEEVKFPRLDVLSLDVDGIEMEILKGFDLDRWQLKAAAVENAFKGQPLRRYFLSRGFELVAETHVNDIWVRMESA